MKFATLAHGSSAALVAPHWGAWIEITTTPKTHPYGTVAPHWGAWIEITKLDRDGDGVAVAPHWGAWIEIRRRPKRHPLMGSHPTGVRGLKSRETNRNRRA